MVSISSSGVVSKGPLGPPRPALFRTTCSPPKVSVAVRTMAAAPSGVATVLVSATATPPLATMSLAVV